MDDDVFFVVALVGATLVMLYGGFQIIRRYPRIRTTKGSSKWETGHNAGCALNAPEDVCICDQFRNHST